MVIAADYPFMDVFWSMIIFFFWVVWIWIVVTVLIDIFRRDDIGGWAKAAWVIFVVILPWLGVLIYLIVEQRRDARAQREAGAGPTPRVRRICARHDWRLRRRDREGQGAARLRRDHAGRVPGAEGQGARVGVASHAGRARASRHEPTRAVASA